MGYFSQSKNKYLSVDLCFTDSLVYTASMKNKGDCILRDISIYESEAKTTSNLLGLIDSNNCSLTIIDKSGALVPTNKNSKYKDYIGSGVKVIIYEMEENESGVVINKTQKGEYYTDSWNNSMVGRTANFASLYCYDKLAYIGQKEIPSLGQLTDMSIRTLLISLFGKLGLVEGTDYVVDGSLDLELMYCVTKGDRVRDTLNEIAQALIARITCDRNGVIQVKPAFNASAYSISGTLAERSGSTFSIKNNTDVGNYTYVKVGYVNLSLEEIPSVLNIVTGVTVGAGKTKTLENIEIPQNTQVVDAVQCRCTWGDTKAPVGDIRYNRTQEGLTVYITNTSSEDITVDVIIKGKSIMASNAYVYDSTKDTSGNVFKVDNTYIQSEAIAQKFADNVKRYILSIKNRYSITAYIDTEIECGKFIKIESPSQNISGNFYINGLSFDVDGAYRVVIDAIRVN